LRPMQTRISESQAALRNLTCLPVGSKSIVIRLALRFKRRQWRSIIVSASAIHIRYRSARSKALSKRDKAGWKAKSSLDRVAITEQFLRRVVSQSARIIGIRVAARNRIETLAHQISDRGGSCPTGVGHLCRRSTPRSDRDSDRTLAAGCPAIGTGMLLVESSHQRAA
jgi:hypothetical protein